MNTYINTLKSAFESHANSDIAIGQQAYMKNKFAFYGIKTPKRRKIQQPFLVKKYLPPKKELKQITTLLWKENKREYHYFAQEFVFKYSNQFQINDIELLEFMINNKSWWDTVDFIATKLVSSYFKQFPQERDKIIQRWLASNNIWLQRSALLFQLKYKDELDTAFLVYIIDSLLGSNEFFINKAIGWILREYSKTNPAWVIDFVNKTALSNLSKKEALRLIIRSRKTAIH